MKSYLLLPMLLLGVQIATAQPATDQEAIIGVIKTLFDAYRAQDTSVMRLLFHPEATMSSALIGQDGQAQWRKGEVQAFLNFAGTKNGNYYDERIYSYNVTVDLPLATAWTEYSFFLNDKFSHCGYNVFTMLKTARGWKIINITDTRRKEGCKTE